MKIAVAGGGPSGLYFSLLMARSDPHHQITVVERNPPDATYGWGVVFSEGTLSELREADRPSYLAITDRFVRWDAIDIIQADQTTRSRGQGFSAIARRELLDVLQNRCGELGVELVFSVEAESTESFADAELVVAADGVNGRMRQIHTAAFGPIQRVHPTKYAWFGADMVFDAFTFIFKETEAGLFQVHAYPFDDRTSTFIVETTESTWRRAGLDRMDETESIAFCEDLFAEYLAGHKLMSNRSTWISFVTLRTASWHHRNLVLMGDAAHTAHFSIGSGTKLAMEDAVALHNSLQENPKDLAAAFAAYELERQPVVDRFQQAANESASYFESVSRYLHFHPHRFAFNLLTRSGRVTHLGLEQRDPALVAAVDRQHEAEARGQSVDERLIPTRPLATPLRLRQLVVPNRVVLSPPTTDDSFSGLPSARCREEMLSVAASGAGLLLTEEVAVSSEGRVTVGSPGIWNDRQMEEWASTIQKLRLAGEGSIGMVLSHAGARASTRPRESGVDRPLLDEGWPLVAASPLPYIRKGPVPTEISNKEMDRVLEAFASAAGRAAEAGCDMAVVDLAGGHLLGGFVSPLTNRRDDDFGGDSAARMRYPLQVMQAVVGAWPGHRPLAARIAATDWLKRGSTAEDVIALAQELKAMGVSLLDVTGGGSVPDACPDYRRLYLLPFADRIRNQVQIPTLARGGITTFDLVDTIVAAGRADLCLLDRRLYR